MTTQADTLDPFDAAVAAAQAELDAREGSDQPPADASDPLDGLSADETEEEAGDDQAAEDGAEQAPEVLDPQEGEDSEDSDELLGDLEIEVVEEPVSETAPGLVAIPGIDEPVSFEQILEWRDGGLRQADYTQKTQAVAAERQRLEKAEQFYNALTQHPKELATQLAVAAGLIEAGATPLKVVELPFRSDEDVQAEVDQKVSEALASHPDIEAARDILAKNWIEAEFAELEKEFGKPLGEKSRNLILATAHKSGTDDLRMVARSLVQMQQEQARKREAAKRAAPAKPTGKASANTVTEPPANFLDAAADAAARLGIELNLDLVS